MLEANGRDKDVWDKGSSDTNTSFFLFEVIVFGNEERNTTLLLLFYPTLTSQAYTLLSLLPVWYMLTR